MSRRFDDPFRGIRSLQHAIADVEKFSGIQKMMENIEKQSALAQLTAKHVVDQKDLLRMVEGPLADLKRAGILNNKLSLSQEMKGMIKLVSQAETQFRLPDVAEQLRLFSQYQDSPAFKSIKDHKESIANIQNAIQAMKAPWLDAQRTLQSVNGFAQLQVIGGTLDKFQSYSSNTAMIIRARLGDWRDPITWPDAIFTNYQQRANFYKERGFDSGLTNFSSEAFEESLSLANLQSNRPTLIEEYGEPVVLSKDDGEEIGFLRTNTAHDWLARMETQIRRFIDALMTKEYGRDWPKKRLPKGLYGKWQEKRTKAQTAGRPVFPLISYADFTDYELVICKRDNWREVFSVFFVRPEYVRETFQRLYPVRVDTMHARLITQDDELFLYVEIKRLIKVIGEFQ